MHAYMYKHAYRVTLKFSIKNYQTFYLSAIKTVGNVDDSEW